MDFLILILIELFGNWFDGLWINPSTRSQITRDKQK